MSKKRVHEIAKEHGLSSKELLEKLKAAGIEAKAAASSVEEDAALQVLGAAAPASSNGAPAAQPATQGVHMVKCVKFGKEMPGLDRIPWKGEIGKRVYDNVSKEAWKLWVEHSKMIMNEFRLNPLDPNGMKVMEEQMEMFFFGEGSKLPESYVPPKH